MTTEAVSRETTNGTGKRPQRGQRPAEASAPPGRPSLVLDLPIELIDIGANVRVNVAGIDELAASIAEHNVLQPIKVRPAGDRYLVTWGQRRLLAAKQAGRTTIPAIIGEDKAAAELSIEQLVENLHRADLNPIDRAQAMRQVVDAGMSQADLARMLGLHPSTVANDLGILDAPDKVRTLIEQGELSPAHQRAMKGLAPKTQGELATRAAKEGWSAHRTEQVVQDEKRRAEADAKQRAAQAKENAAHREQLEASIGEFESKKVPKDALIIVDTSYSSEGGHLASLIKAAGYGNTRVAASWNEIEARPAGGVCDCTAWKAKQNVTYGRWDSKSGHQETTYRVSVTKGCIVRKHQQAKQAVAESVRRAKEATGEKVRSYVREHAEAWPIADLVAGHYPQGIAIQRILAEAALWSLLSYGKANWADARGGKRSDPWPTIHGLSDEDLATELAKAIAGDFRDHDGVRVGWAMLATELGLVDEPVETPAPKKAVNQRRQERINAEAIASVEAAS